MIQGSRKEKKFQNNWFCLNSSLLKNMFLSELVQNFQSLNSLGGEEVYKHFTKNLPTIGNPTHATDESLTTDRPSG